MHTHTHTVCLPLYLIFTLSLTLALSLSRLLSRLLSRSLSRPLMHIFLIVRLILRTRVRDSLCFPLSLSVVSFHCLPCLSPDSQSLSRSLCVSPSLCLHVCLYLSLSPTHASLRSLSLFCLSLLSFCFLSLSLSLPLIYLALSRALFFALTHALSFARSVFFSLFLSHPVFLTSRFRSRDLVVLSRSLALSLSRSLALSLSRSLALVVSFSRSLWLACSLYSSLDQSRFLSRAHARSARYLSHVRMFSVSLLLSLYNSHDSHDLSTGLPFSPLSLILSGTMQNSISSESYSYTHA